MRVCGQELFLSFLRRESPLSSSFPKRDHFEES
jgi:hypothetical protein